MINTTNAQSRNAAIQRLFWIGFGCFIAFIVVYLIRNPTPEGPNPHYVYLADSFLHGRLDINAINSKAYDISYYQGQRQIPFGALPGVLMMPFVALFGHGFHQVYMVYILSGISGWILWLLLGSLGVVSSARTWLAALLFVSSPYLYNFLLDGPWPLQHALTMTTTLLAIYIVLHQPLADLRWRAWLLIGLLVGCSLLNRYAVVLSLLFFLWLLVEEGRMLRWPLRRYLVPLSGMGLGVGLCLATFMLFNYARFDNPLQTGFSLCDWPPAQRAAYNQGFFSLAHVPKNLLSAFLSGPIPTTAFGPTVAHPVLPFPWIQPNPWGMSLFLTSPALLYAFRSGLDTPLKRACWATTVLLFATLMLYFWSGVPQIGYRYALDFFPFLIILLALQWQMGVSTLGRWLILAGGLFCSWCLLSIQLSSP